MARVRPGVFQSIVEHKYALERVYRVTLETIRLKHTGNSISDETVTMSPDFFLLFTILFYFSANFPRVIAHHWRGNFILSHTVLGVLKESVNQFNLNIMKFIMSISF